MAQEVTKKEQTLPSTDVNFEDYAGAGLENVTSDDILIPRLGILQALSPQLNKKKAEYIEGGNIGDIADVSSGILYEPPIEFLPVKFSKAYIEWAPRESDKGLIAIHTDKSIYDECEQNEDGQWMKGENIVLETAQFFGLNLSAGNQKCFIAMAATQLKHSRKWLTLSMSDKEKRADGSDFTPPLFYRTYKIDTAEESNNKGDWSAWKIERGVKLSEHPEGAQLFKEAVEFLKQLDDGTAKADHSDGEVDTGGSEGAM
jgi:hypothetical protein